MKRIQKYYFTFFFFLLFALPVKAQTQHTSLFETTDSVYMYHTLLDAYSFHFSGIMAIKKIDDTHRIIFSTETGSTLFDFTLTKKKCKANYVMKAMNNVLFIALIKSDLKDLLQTYKYKKNYIKFVYEEIASYEVYESNQAADNGVNKTKDIKLTFTKNKEIKKIIFFQFISNNKSSESTISISHQNRPIKIEMTAFSNSAD